jgi:hypothetical protein
VSCTLDAFHHCHSQRAECRVWDLELAPCVERCSRGHGTQRQTSRWRVSADARVS